MSVKRQLNLDRVPRDAFGGATRLLSISARLAAGDHLTDEEVTDVFGREVLPHFNFAQSCLAGLTRRTGECAFSHSADVTLRAIDMGYPVHIIELALLHDTVEDSSTDLFEFVRQLNSVADQFGHQIAKDVRHLSNRYELIARTLGKLIRAEGWAPPSNREAMVGALHGLRQRLPSELQYSFNAEIDLLIRWVEYCWREPPQGYRGDPVDQLRSDVYTLFIEDIYSESWVRVRSQPGVLSECLVVVKLLDIVDNLRTSPVVIWKSIKRVITKAEIFLDITFPLEVHCRANLSNTQTFARLYHFLKYSLVQNLLERQKAVTFLADTRFSFLSGFLESEVNRLCNKYKVQQRAVSRLLGLRKSIRNQNMGLPE